MKTFLEKTLFPKFAKIKQEKLYQDHKSLYQETVQAKGLPTPSYEVTKEEGPDHEKTFTINVLVNNEVTGTGTGKSKQQAQQAAARSALEKLGGER